MAAVIGTDVKEEIVKKYIPLVKYISSRIFTGKSKYIEYEDMVSYGMIGLMDAINKFDESKGMKFSTYASIRIKGAIIDEIRKISPISKGAIDKLNRYNETVDNLQNKLHREPSDAEIAEELGISTKDIMEIEGYINYMSVVSLDEIICLKDDDVSVISTIKDENSPCPEAAFQDKEQIEYLSKALDILNEKDKTILSLYYYDELTLKEIGKILNVSESRVCQLHSRAIMHLRKAMQELKYME
ncbi:MAG: FliA/WhiG family RNA polymerase sigma factor [Solirubrobacterales bacterium]